MPGPGSLSVRAVVGRCVLGALALGPLGCAKFPEEAQPQSTRLTISFTVDGKIRTGLGQDEFGLPYVYMVALRVSQDANPIDDGPIPVIAPPWGNGFVAGNATHFVWWSRQFSPNYALFRFRDPLLNEYVQTGFPVTFTDVRQGDRTLRFSVDLDQLVPDPQERARIRSVQINFLTMDRIPQGGFDKFWDALGDGRLPTEVNRFLLIPLTTSGVYDNRRAGGIEPRGDTPDPDLDIVDWSVEVTVP